MQRKRLWLFGGISGMAAVCCYLVAIAIPWPDSQLGVSTSLMVISGFPILGIIYSYALYDFLAAGKDGAANRLGMVFAAIAFTTLLAMIVVQLAVGSGLGEITRDLDKVTARALRRGLRLVDLGLDVAWDILGSFWLIFSGWAIRKRKGLGAVWAIPSIAFGIALIVLNAATFPWPPGDHGLFDVGPVVGIFVLMLSGRLAFLGGRRETPDSPGGLASTASEDSTRPAVLCQQ